MVLKKQVSSLKSVKKYCQKSIKSEDLSPDTKKKRNMLNISNNNSNSSIDSIPKSPKSPTKSKFRKLSMIIEQKKSN